ncbi:zinc finger CW-type PWWP domain protein 1 isoform X9 [Canis lupus familiaris]|uniref:zinc finger CW-type PWWP domain protein 1 isoform X9 n=1 Tax=Canis lupus familiaris TaxID=9615 RepID=UPI0015F1901C|nr:zinc finger CW-type PWWP domain protein 1 isoform X9 [Canis lupus familiaris]
MMAMLQSKEECGKGPKKTCTPSAQKLYSMMCYSPNSSKEESLGVSSPKARLKKKEEKTTTENGSSSGQENKGKPQDKQAEKEKEKSSLTNAEFEEIIQIVLRKSLQECLGMAYKTSCAQPIRCTLLDKEPGIAASTDNDNADGKKNIIFRERVMVPHILEISATQEAGVTSVIKTSKPGQPDPAPSEKKSNRPFLSKGKKGAQDEKMEKTQSGHEHRQKDQLKKTVQVDSQIRNQQRGKGGDFGQCLVWVQCSSPNCEKWRRLCGNIDPSVLPDDWSCDQNTDLKYNHCDIPEESWTGRESDVAYASYIPGSIIWAKQYGYPWWPGMVESDPDLGEYFLFASHLDSLPRVKARRRTRGHFLFQSKYHVTFFGETVSRAWIPVNMLKNFQELSLELAGVKKCRNKDCNQKLGAALMMAQEAEQISIQDPTLPSPKPARIQTKKPKARGLADGQDGTLQRKTLKRSLGNESAAPPVLIMGRKEGGHGKSEPDQPGPKKKFRAPQSKDSVISLSEDKEARMAPKGLTPPAHLGVCPVMGTEGWKCLQEAGSVPPDDEAFSDLDLEQILEDVGKEPEQLEEPQCGDDPGEFTLAFFEE